MRRVVIAVIAVLASLPVVGLHGSWTGAGAAAAAACPTANAPVTVAPSPASPGYTLTRGCAAGFDGTAIVYDLFEPLDASAAHPVYAVLEGPGWGGGGGYAATCAASKWGASTEMPPVLAADYAYLTWDPRGFGESGGAAEVDDPQFEGRDVSALIDQALRGRPEIAVDSNPRDSTHGQPAVGMMGGSYGGGIQFAAAADSRIKALVPKWAWNDLDYSLFPGGVPKQTWLQFLIGEGIAVSAASHYTTLESCDRVAGQQVTPIYDTNLYRAWAQATATGYPDAQTLEWFKQRSIASFGTGAEANVPRVPTLLLQGATDTLFNLNEAWANYQLVKAAHPTVPLKLIGYCGGHAGCQYAAAAPSGYAAHVSAEDFVVAQTMNWFDVYLRHDQGATVSLPDVLLQDETGMWHAHNTFPTADAPGAATYVTSNVSGSLISTGVPTDPNNPFTIEEFPTSANANDPGALTVPVLTAPANGNGLMVVGEPHVNLNVTVTGSSADLLFRLVDKARDVRCSTEPCWSSQTAVVDGQTAAIRLDNLDLANGASSPRLPPQPQHVSLDLVGVDYKLPPGDTLELQISSASTPSASNRGVAVTTFDGNVSVPSIPVVSEDQPTIRLGGSPSGRVDKQATFTASLVDAAGRPLAGEPVEFTFDSGVLGSARTDENGIATISTVLSGPARQTTISALFGGDTHEFPAETTTPFTIEKSVTTTNVAAARSQGTTVASASLNESDPARPLAGRRVDFTLDGRPVGSATTSGDGVASFNFGRSAKPGDTITAIYTGDDSYLGSSASAAVPPH